MLLTIILFVLGILGLLKGADLFVDVSVDISKRLKISPLIIGLTLVSIGTSLPEIVVSISASIKGSSEIALGNVTGSNLFNLLFIVGVCAIMTPITTNKSFVKYEYTPVILSMVVVLGTSTICWLLDAPLLRIIGILFILLYVVYLLYLIRRNRGTVEEIEPPVLQIGSSILYLIIGIGLLIFCGQITVNSATEIAAQLGMSERIIGITIVGVGTSLPELITSVMAMRKKEKDIAMGNVIGSNIANILLIVGASCTIQPIPVDATNLVDICILTVICFIVPILMHSGNKINKFEGMLMISAYIGYIIYILL